MTGPAAIPCFLGALASRSMRHPLLDLPPLDALRGFVAVARRTSITLAAQDLCLTQSAVSRQVQALEESLGAPLLARSHRAVALTPLGEQLFALASPLLEQLADFAREARSGQGPRSVTLTASVGVTGLWLLPRLGDFQRRHPDIDVRVTAGSQVFDLRHEGLDLAIRYCRAGDALPGAQRLFGEELVPVAAPAIAARARGAALLDEVLLEHDDRARPWLRWSEWLRALGLPADRTPRTLRLNQYDLVLQAAAQGQGVGIAMLALVQPMLDDGRLVRLPGARPARSDYAFHLVPATTAPRPEVATFAAWVVEQAAHTDAAVRRGERP